MSDDAGERGGSGGRSAPSVLNVELMPIADEALRNLGQLYSYDFAEFVPEAVDGSGRFVRHLIDKYLDDDHERFGINAGGELAGFAIVSRGDAFRDPDEQVWWMDEFFVMRPYRRRGVGARAATMLFERHPGMWEVGQLEANTPAQAFWRDVIGSYTGGRFEEIRMDDDRWTGPVQYFCSP